MKRSLDKTDGAILNKAGLLACHPQLGTAWEEVAFSGDAPLQDFLPDPHGSKCD
jgi:hypothetical protein